MSEFGLWTRRQLTMGTAECRFHAHAYYDIPVMDEAARFVIGHQVRFQGRQPTVTDDIEIGIVDMEAGAEWQPLGRTSAWSWQQGAMSQFLPAQPATKPRAAWNIRRSDNEFGARIYDLSRDDVQDLDVPLYAVAPCGTAALSLDMSRLNTLRPGYGYANSSDRSLRRKPHDEGVRHVDLGSGKTSLILPLARAVDILMRHLPLKARAKHLLKRYHYWFNHAKISPDGRRFTVKLRWRNIGKPWSDKQGVSLTAGMDGSDVRLLAPATSHVIWQNERQLYFWQSGGLFLYKDTAPKGTKVEQVAPELITTNVHIRHMPAKPHLFVFDTPYREDIDVLLLDRRTGRHEQIAAFTGHRPKTGPFRCDLHPCPSVSGERIIVTSLEDGGRQIYLLELQKG
ncbi:MAG: hypothetical protein V2J26_00915 [Pacificimonas sp.]|nr:hypothetical protein [Pacificimonas sp.]